MHPRSTRPLPALIGLAIVALLVAPAALAQVPAPGVVYLPFVANTSVPTPGPGAELQVVAAADAYLFEAEPNGNFGSDVYLMAGYDGDRLEKEGTVRSLVRFDLPPGSASPVAKATLRVYYGGYSDITDATRLTSTRAAEEPWTESTVSWENQPAQGAAYGSVAITANQEWGYREIDVTTLAQQWFDGSRPNFGIYLTGPEVSGSDYSYRIFLSRETPSPPQLLIQFE